MRRPTLSVRDPLLWARTVQLVLLCVVTVAMLGAGQSRFDRLGHELMCSCGCGQVLLECNHVSCPDSPVMIAELHAQLATGKSDTEVLNWFATKYGAIILAAPVRGGFDYVAWIVPFTLFLLATVGTFALVWVWKRRTLGRARLAAGFDGGPAADATPVAQNDPQQAAKNRALRERIRRETEY